MERMNRFARIAAALLWLVGGVALPSAEAGPCAPAPIGARTLWAAADVDGDRVVDVIRVSTAVDTALPELVASGCTRVRVPLATMTGEVLAAEDIDADRDLDLVQYDATGAAVRAWINDGTGQFEPAEPAAPATARPHAAVTVHRSVPDILSVAPPRERSSVAPSSAAGVAAGNAQRAAPAAAAPQPASPARLSSHPRAPPPTFGSTSCL